VVKTTIWIAVASGALACVATTLACNAVLGINEAKLDRSLAVTDGASGNDGAGGDDAQIADAGADTGDPYSCDSYCTVIMNNCKVPNQEYTTREVCLAMCSHFEPGVPGEQSNDSRACRVYHAGAAAGDPAVHCRHAGPLGGGHCGEKPCESFCLLDFALCGGRADFPYDGGEGTCRAQCPQFSYLAGGDAGDLTLTSGDTLNCRLYHLESAYDVSNPAAQSTHCPHTGVQSPTCN
jgi:hypothetical protein